VKKTNNRRGSKQSLSHNRGVSLLLTTVGTPSKDQFSDSAVTTPYSDVRRIDDESELFPSVENTPVKPSRQNKADSPSASKDAPDSKINEGENEDKENDEVPLSSGLACFFCFAFR